MSASVSAIIISPYQFLQHAIVMQTVTHAASILGDSDRLEFPNFDAIPTLRLRFDDIHAPSRGWAPPGPEHIAELIEFGRCWNGSGSIIVHCRAGSSRSPAAALILAALLDRPDSDELVRRVASAKAYFRPHTGMLRIADRLLERRTSLVDLVRSLPVPTRTDPWGPVSVSLGPLESASEASAGS